MADPRPTPSKPAAPKAVKELGKTAKSLERSADAVEVSAGAIETSAVELTDSADRRTELASNRTMLAGERTYAAWVRTGLAALASGVGARALFEPWLPFWVTGAAASILVLFAAFCFVAAVWREIHPGASRPSPDAPKLPSWMFLAINGLLMLTAVAALIAVWTPAARRTPTRPPRSADGRGQVARSAARGGEV